MKKKNSITANFLFLIFVFLAVACGSNKSNSQRVTGIYESKSHTSFQRAWYNIKTETLFATGTTLTLNEDSTFNLTTCGNIIDGKWTFDSDSVYLYAHSNKWRIDSLQQFGFHGKWPTVSERPITYYRKKPGELQSISHSNSGKKKRFLKELVKKTANKK